MVVLIVGFFCLNNSHTFKHGGHILLMAFARPDLSEAIGLWQLIRRH